MDRTILAKAINKTDIDNFKRTKKWDDLPYHKKLTYLGKADHVIRALKFIESRGIDDNNKDICKRCNEKHSPLKNCADGGHVNLNTHYDCRLMKDCLRSVYNGEEDCLGCDQYIGDDNNKDS